jgi:hypothetical protein
VLYGRSQRFLLCGDSSGKLALCELLGSNKSSNSIDNAVLIALDGINCEEEIAKTRSANPSSEIWRSFGGHSSHIDSIVWCAVKRYNIGFIYDDDLCLRLFVCGNRSLKFDGDIEDVEADKNSDEEGKDDDEEKKKKNPIVEKDKEVVKWEVFCVPEEDGGVISQVKVPYA